jgi:hypothetical protein
MKSVKEGSSRWVRRVIIILHILFICCKFVKCLQIQHYFYPSVLLLLNF